MKLVGGCAAIYFQNYLCSITVNNSFIINNKARLMGGGFFLQHNYGNLTYINNTFRNNSAINDGNSSLKESAGGAIYSFGYTTSIIYLEFNKFIMNKAERGAGIAALSSNITELNSLYQGFKHHIIFLNII